MNTTGAVLTHKQAVGSKNCMQCCVSYMLGLPLESVPDFATDGGWELFSDFAESQGYAAVMLPGSREFEADYLASGTTARGTSHMVVMNDGKLVHDPHPSNAGLVDVQCVWLLAKRATPRTVQADEHAEFETAAKAYTSNVNFERDGYTQALYTAPQPTHAQPVAREPLSDEEVDSLCKVGFVYVIDGKVTRTPTQYRDELKAAQRYGLRKGEHAHGIKGGQHGTE